MGIVMLYLYMYADLYKKKLEFNVLTHIAECDSDSRITYTADK